MDFVRLALVNLYKASPKQARQRKFFLRFFYYLFNNTNPIYKLSTAVKRTCRTKPNKAIIIPPAVFRNCLTFLNLVCLFSSDSPWLLGLIETAVHLNAVWWINWTRLFEIASLPGMRPLLTVAKFTTKYEFQLFIYQGNNKVNVTHSLVACCSIRHWYSENSCVHRTSTKWNSLVKGKAHYLGKVLLKLSESCAPKISGFRFHKSGVSPLRHATVAPTQTEQMHHIRESVKSCIWRRSKSHLEW